MAGHLFIKASIPPIIPSIGPTKKPPMPNKPTIGKTSITTPHLLAFSDFLSIKYPPIIRIAPMPIERVDI